MLRFKVIVRTTLCTCLVLALVLPAFATEYTPNSIFYFRPNTGTVYANVEGGGNSFPIAVNSNGNWLSAQTGLFVGATYNGTGDNFVNHETYKLVMTFSAGATTSITNPEASYLVGLPAAPAAGLYNWKDRVESDIRPTATGVGSSAFTITFENIPWNFMSGVSTVGVFIPKSVMSVSGAIILLNCYLDLTSEYDELAYQKEVNERLERLQGSLDGIEDSLDGVQDSLDGIEDSLENALDNELNMNENASNIAKGDAEGALSQLVNYAENYGGVFNQILAFCTSETKLTEIPLPNGFINLGGKQLDIWAGATGVDISTWLNNPDVAKLVTIFKFVSTLAIVCSAIFWVHQVKEWITNLDSVAIPKLPFALDDFSGLDSSGRVKYSGKRYEDE